MGIRVLSIFKGQGYLKNFLKKGIDKRNIKCYNIRVKDKEKRYKIMIKVFGFNTEDMEEKDFIKKINKKVPQFKGNEDCWITDEEMYNIFDFVFSFFTEEEKNIFKTYNDYRIIIPQGDFETDVIADYIETYF